MQTDNKCWGCNKPIYEDNGLKGKFMCINNRCVRYGLLSNVYLAPQPPEPPKEEKKSVKIAKEKLTDDKNIPTD